jgi:hypothetical protein
VIQTLVIQQLYGYSSRDEIGSIMHNKPEYHDELLRATNAVEAMNATIKPFQTFN